MVKPFLAAFELVLLYKAVMAGCLFLAITLAGDQKATIHELDPAQWLERALWHVVSCLALYLLRSSTDTAPRRRNAGRGSPACRFCTEMWYKRV